jgi:flagellar assembly protein FliH
VVNVLYSASTPFTFQDLGGETTEGARPKFVTLFSTGQEESVETAEEAPLDEATGDEADFGDGGPSRGESMPHRANIPDRETIEDLSRKAFEDAYAQGEKAGFEMGMRKAESIAKRLEKQIEEVVSFKDELRERYERSATDLALILAESLVLRECSVKGDVLADMIRKALEACADRGQLVVKVRKEDVKFIEGLASEHLKIVADEGLKEPGFLIETNMGDIDGKISTQIEELKTALAGYHAE